MAAVTGVLPNSCFVNADSWLSEGGAETTMGATATRGASNLLAQKAKMPTKQRPKATAANLEKKFVDSEIAIAKNKNETLKIMRLQQASS